MKRLLAILFFASVCLAQSSISGTVSISGTASLGASGGGGGGSITFNRAAVGATFLNSAGPVTTSAFSTASGDHLYIACLGDLKNGSVAVSTNDSDVVSAALVSSSGSASDHIAVALYEVKSAIANASKTVTCTSTTFTSEFAVIALNVSGTNATSDLDQTATGQVTGSAATSVTSGAYTTTSANEIIIACAESSVTTAHTAGTGFTIPTGGHAEALGGGSRSVSCEYKIVSATQTGVTAVTNGGSGVWQQVVATFKQ